FVDEILRENGVRSAVISLGGNVQTLGSKPDGTKWKIAIRDPENPSGYLGIVTTEEKAVITSGAYERFFEEDGINYHHILNPSTGYPAESGIISSTVICSDGTLADGLSTALYVIGLEKSSDLWKNSDVEFDFILMTSDKHVYITENIKNDFISDYSYSIISK
ncbi:MAG: FAD:protein FMN transferase, partial [Parasporobacterium sp.]|nr:FAD:protein FMN transferase [Parasporobacterium sp.]